MGPLVIGMREEIWFGDEIFNRQEMVSMTSSWARFARAVGDSVSPPPPLKAQSSGFFLDLKKYCEFPIFGVFFLLI